MSRKDESFIPKIERSIDIYGIINNELVHSVERRLTHLLKKNSKDPITVYINSPGGEIDSALAILDLIHPKKKHPWIITVGEEIAQSCAADILSSGDYAIALPQCRILHHGIRFITDVITRERASLWEQALRTQNNQYAQNLLEKNQERFIIRFVLMEDQIAKIGESLSRVNNSDVTCFRKLVSDNLSNKAKRVLNKAKRRDERYNKLLNYIEENIGGKITLPLDTSHIKAIIDFGSMGDQNHNSREFTDFDLVQVIDDFFLLNANLTSLANGTLKKMCGSWASKAYSQITSARAGQTRLSPAAQRQLLIRRIQPIWSFFVSVCYTLQESENDLTAEDAAYLGLIDEVMGNKKIESLGELLG